MHTRILIALTTVLFVAADDEAVVKERQSFQGRWETVSATIEGTAVSKAMLGDQVAVFEGSTYKQVGGGQVVEEGEFEINPKADPRTLDFIIKTGNDAGKRQLGIYKLEGKTLTLGLARPGGTKRPSTFESKAGSSTMIFLFERPRPAPEKKDK